MGSADAKAFMRIWEGPRLGGIPRAYKGDEFPNRINGGEIW